jgi:hypothetical protein
MNSPPDWRQARQAHNTDECQELPTYRFADGLERERIRFGSESPSWALTADGHTCICGAQRGELHGAYCKFEPCPHCDRQAIGCVENRDLYPR